MHDRDDATRMAVKNTPDLRRSQVFQQVESYRYLLLVIYTLHLTKSPVI